jgi:hypothetical protein
VNVKVALLATAAVVGSTAIVPSPLTGQMTLSGDEVTEVIRVRLITSVAVKLAGPAYPGGVACASSVKLFAPGDGVTLNPVVPS